MNIQKRIFALILSVLIVIGCAACSSNEAPAQDDAQETPEATQTVDIEVTAEPAEETPEAEIEDLDVEAPPSPYEPPEQAPISEEQETDSAEEAPSINTYTTSNIRYGNSVTCPIFQLDYPDGWTITTEETDTTTFPERDILSNSLGITITYFEVSPATNFYFGRFASQIEVTKVADSSFTPGTPAGGATDCSYLGDFMVAELRTIGTMSMDTDMDYTPVEDGAVCYAVVPESYAGIHDVAGVQGIYGEFSFGYPTALYGLIAEAPTGRFMESEAEEVIAILSSFRAAN